MASSSASGQPIEAYQSLPGAPSGDDQELYVPFRQWLTANPGRPVIVAGLGLVLLQALLRAWVKFDGWFLVDDLAFIGRAQTMRLWSTDYLLAGWNGHLMPGAFAVVKFFDHFWPLDYTPVAIGDLLVQSLVGIAVLRLLIELFGVRRAILVPLTVFLLTTLTLPAFLWWAAALNQLWGQLAMALALLAHVRYHRTGKLRWGLTGVLAVAFGLLFSEKVLLVEIALVGLSVLYFTPGRPLARLRAAWRRNWIVSLAHIGLCSAYIAAYLTLVAAPASRAGGEFRITVSTLGYTLTSALLPAIFGGPLTWDKVPAGGTASPQPWLVVLSALLGTAVVWSSIALRARAVFGWLIAGVYVLANVLILGFTRAAFFGPSVAGEFRYQTDNAMILVVFGSMAFLPVVGTFRRGALQPLVRRGGVGNEVPTGPFSMALRRHGRTVMTCCTVVVALLAVISTLRYDPYWRNTQQPAFFANLRSTLAGTDHRLTVADTQLGFFPTTTASHLMGGFKPTPYFLKRGSSADTVFVPDAEGKLRAAEVDGIRGKAGPDHGCGWLVGADPVTIPLQRPVFPWLWGVQIGYLASHDTDTTVTAGSVTTNVHIQAGVHHLFVLSDGAADDIRFGALGYGTLCTDDVIVGNFKPLAGTSPAGVFGARE